MQHRQRVSPLSVPTISVFCSRPRSPSAWWRCVFPRCWWLELGIFAINIRKHTGVSKNRGTPKWMVYKILSGKTLLKWMIWEENPLFSETSIFLLGKGGVGRGWGLPYRFSIKKWPLQRSRKAGLAYFPQESEPIPRVGLRVPIPSP